MLERAKARVMTPDCAAFMERGQAALRVIPGTSA
jgi:hypothetical protein